MQALGAFVVYFTVYAQEGFRPSTLLNLRVEWEKGYVNDLEDSYGQEWVRAGPPAVSSWEDREGTKQVTAFSVNGACGPLGHSGLPLSGLSSPLELGA